MNQKMNKLLIETFHSLTNEWNETKSGISADFSFDKSDELIEVFNNLKFDKSNTPLNGYWVYHECLTCSEHNSKPTIHAEIISTENCLLFLDDYRNPYIDEFSEYLEISPIKDEENEIIWIKDYEDFVYYLNTQQLPLGVMFDHDLKPEQYTPKEYWDDYEKSRLYQLKMRENPNYGKSGLDCVNYIVEYCKFNNFKLPKCISHSANPVGRDNINNIIKINK